jgi:hypothetical protein
VVSPLRIARGHGQNSSGTVRPPGRLPQPKNLAEAFLIHEGRMTRADLRRQRTPIEPIEDALRLNLRPGVYFVSERDLGAVTRVDSLKTKPPTREFRKDDADLATEEELSLTDEEPSEPDEGLFDIHGALACRDVSSELPASRYERGRRR